jgi:hypothetical protein
MLTKYIFLLFIFGINNSSDKNRKSQSNNHFPKPGRWRHSPTLSSTEKGLFIATSFFMLFKLLKK